MSIHHFFLSVYLELEQNSEEKPADTNLYSLRGPAPLHHTLLAGHTRTGVTLQTLDFKHFDHGVILDQTPPPGFEIPNPNSCTVPELLKLVTPKAAQMLVNGIRNGVFVPPVKDASWRSSKGEQKLIHATKIAPEDRHINWRDWSLAEIFKRNRVLGPLWSLARVGEQDHDRPPIMKRIIFTEIEEADPPEVLKADGSLIHEPGLPFVNDNQPTEPGQLKRLYICTSDSKFICLRQVKVEGQQATDGVRAGLKAGILEPNMIKEGWSHFLEPLR